jgi:hypothetical protein
VASVRIDAMPRLHDLAPDDLAALNVATRGRLLVVLREMIEGGLVPHIFVEPFGARWVARVLGVRGEHGESLVREAEVPIAWQQLREHDRLSILLLWIAEIREAQERWWRRINRRQRALGLLEIP